MTNSRTARQTPSRAGDVQTLEHRQLLSATYQFPSDALEYQSYDGWGNNVASPSLGNAEVLLERYATANYSDGYEVPNDIDMPSPREVSNIVAAQSESQVNDRYLTNLTWMWGQFLDHDIDLSPTTGDIGIPEAYPISVPAGDPDFDPTGTGTAEIPLDRSMYSNDLGVRHQFNTITSFVDGSNVYGSNEERAHALRTFTGGKLKTSAGDLLPFNEEGLENAGGPSSDLFLAGDVRANENATLSSMHTLFVREHNRLADEFAQKDPSLSDEDIYQRARRIVISELQAITYNEFLPALLGYGAIPKYEGYNPNVNPNIFNEFSTAAFRLGHTLLSSEVLRLDANGNVVPEGNLALRDAFFNPQAVIDGGIDSILRGAAASLSQELDTNVIDDVRNFLFGQPGAGGLDLAALNIQRGRDHGLPTYNELRKSVGLSPAASYADITSDPELQAKLDETYCDCGIDAVELWVGLLSEDHLPNSSVGETLRLLLVDQFSRLRDGDRFWYENAFRNNASMLSLLNSTTLKDVIERNTEITGLQDNVFFDSRVVIHQLHELPEAHRANRIRVVVTDTRVVIRDVRTTVALQKFNRATDDIRQIIIRGSDLQIDRVDIDLRRTSTPLEGGIVFDGGLNDRDRISVLGIDGKDTVDITLNTIKFGGHSIYFTGVELIDLRTLISGDRINIAPEVRYQIQTRLYNKPVRSRGPHTQLAARPAPDLVPWTQNDREDSATIQDLYHRVAQLLVDEDPDDLLSKLQ